MQVSIKGVNYLFEPEKVAWKQKRDEFAIVQIAEHRCFVKRYKVNAPSAWGLMVTLKNQPVGNLATIYDAVQVKVNSLNIFYLFSECIQGCTLKEYILNGDIPNPSHVFNHIHSALSEIHAKGYWFSDFNEENIFVASGLMKKYYLIDTDSCWSDQISPSHVPNEKGGLPGASQNLGKFVLEYYKTYLPSLNIINYNQLSGTNLNYLQLLVLMSKLRTYKNNKAIDTSFKYIKPNSFRNLHKFIHDKNSSYSKGLFMIACKATVNIKEPARVMSENLLA
jgi:hypothetical protein